MKLFNCNFSINSQTTSAWEGLVKILFDLAKDPEYDEVELKLALEHAYHHLNFAWHIRGVDKKRAVKCVKKDFINWSKYPVGDILEYR